MSTANHNGPRESFLTSKSTATGHLAFAPVFSVLPFLVGSVFGTFFALLLTAALSTVANDFIDSFGVSIILGVLIGSTIMSLWSASVTNDAVRDWFPKEKSGLFFQAKKKISLRMKLAMLFYRLGPTVLLEEADPYLMTQTKAILVRHSISYFIEIHTVDALKAWDAALDSATPAPSTSAIKTEEASHSSDPNIIGLLMAENKNLFDEYRKIFDKHMRLSDQLADEERENKRLLEQMAYQGEQLAYQKKSADACVCRPCAQSYKHEQEIF